MNGNQETGLGPFLGQSASDWLAQFSAVVDSLNKSIATTQGQFTTYLGPEQEQSFQDWVKQNKIPWQDSPTADYDMRGFYQAMISGDPNAHRSSANLHFPDTWKTPYHKTFSNESIYSAGRPAPHWEGDRLIDDHGNVVADETPKAASQ